MPVASVPVKVIGVVVVLPWSPSFDSSFASLLTNATVVTVVTADVSSVSSVSFSSFWSFSVLSSSSCLAQSAVAVAWIAFTAAWRICFSVASAVSMTEVAR